MAAYAIQKGVHGHRASIEVMDCGTYLLIKGGVLINFTGVSFLSHIGWFEVWGKGGTNGSCAWIKMLSHHYYPHCLNIVNTIFEGDPAGSPIQNKHEGREIPYQQKCMIKNLLAHCQGVAKVYKVLYM